LSDSGLPFGLFKWQNELYSAFKKLFIRNEVFWSFFYTSMDFYKSFHPLKLFLGQSNLIVFFLPIILETILELFTLCIFCNFGFSLVNFGLLFFRVDLATLFNVFLCVKGFPWNLFNEKQMRKMAME
jgi:hypothetical protein